MSYRLFVIAGENELLRSMAENLGDEVEVRLLESANDALWEVRTAPPEVILADLHLPDIGGLEMAEILLSFELPTKVLLYSRELDPTAQKQAETYEVYSFLYEPLSIEDLRNTLRDAAHSAQEAMAAAEAIAAAEEDVSSLPSEPIEPPDELEPDITPELADSETEPEIAVSEPVAPEPKPDLPSSDRSFKPARVRLPSMAERLSRSGRITSRKRDNVETKPAEPTPPPTPAPDPHRRHGGTLVLTADNLAPIQSIMSRLAQDLGTQCIMLTDRAGMVLVEVGNTHDLPTMILLPLLSTSFSTAGEVARQLREEDATTLYIHEGVNYDLYCFDIAQRFLLVLVFNKKVASSKIGTVWISTKRAIRELQDALS